MTRALDRLAAWLCLALLLLTGLVPSQGFVVCIEDDGCVSVELKAPEAGCDGCEGHDSDEAASEVASIDGAEAPCPCIDLAVPSSPAQLWTQSRIFGVELATFVAPPLAFRVDSIVPAIAAIRGPPPVVPRVADSLAHIRSVILLV